MYILSHSQREVLFALLTLYNKFKKPIKSKDIASFVGKDEGTVRNIVISLKSLGLVESKTGPAGGYRPTLKAHEYAKLPLLPFIGNVKVYKDSEELSLSVTNLELIDVTNPSGNKAVIRVVGDISDIKEGDYIRIGPIPYVRLIIEGKILLVDTIRKEIIIDVNKIVSIPKEKVYNIMSKQLITLPSTISIKEASKILTKYNIGGAPVIDDNNNIIGIISRSDIIKAVANDEINVSISKYMNNKVITINSNDDILNAIKIMLKDDVDRLIVVDNDNKPIGLITRGDIFKIISSYKL